MGMSEYKHRIHLIIPAIEQAAGNVLATAIDPDTGGAHTFDNPNTSATGEGPATHIFINTLATDAMLATMNAALAGGGIAVQFWRTDRAGILQLSNVSADRIGQPWTTADTLQAAGLQFVVTEAAA